MNNSESGRKLNQAVNTTSRAVGGALSHAKGALTNWWSSLSTNNTNATDGGLGGGGKINNGTALNDYDTIDNGQQNKTLNNCVENADQNQMKNFNENNKRNGDVDNTKIDFESLKMQPEFTNQSNDNVGGIVEIGIEAMVLHTK